MNQRMSLERRIADWMADEASGVAADQLVTQIITTTRRQRPRPRWLANLQETPMHTQARVVVGSPTRRLTIAAALLVLAAVVAAAVAGAFLLRPQPPSDDWPGFRGDTSRSGLAVRGPVGNPVVQWTFHANGGVGTNLSVAGDLVLVSSDDGILHALDIGDGTERWSFKATPPMGGTLAIDGRVYAVDGNGNIHALDLADGRSVWTSTVALQTPTYLTELEGRLYVGTIDGFVVALDASTGSEAWRTRVSPDGSPVHSPTAADGIVVAATDDGYFASLDPASGAVRWQIQVGSNPVGTPVLNGGIAYLGANPDSASGRLIAVDAGTGAERWRIEGAFLSPSVADGVAYTTSPLGIVIARDLGSGRELWRTTFDGSDRAVAVAGNVVYVVSDPTRRIGALDRATGGELWTFDVDGTNQCCIAVARGLVFVATQRGTVYAIGGDGAALTPRSPSTAPSPSATSDASSTPTSPSALTQLDTNVAWAATAPDGFIPWGLAQTTDGMLWAAEGIDNRFAIFTPDGTFVERWGSGGAGNGEFDLTRSNGDPYGMVAFAPDGSFYVLDVGNRRVQHFDPDRTFLEAWGGFGSDPGQFNDPISIAVDREGMVSVLDNVREVIESYDAHGKVLGSIPAFPESVGANDGANQLSVGPNGHFYVSVVRPNEVIELDRDGTLITTFGAPASGEGAFTDQPNRAGFDAAGHVYVTQGVDRGDHPGVQVFDRDGTYLGGFASVGTGDADLGFGWGLVVANDGIYVTDASGVPDIGLRSAIRKFEPIDFP